MLAVLITGAIVSKGYEDAPALKFTEGDKAVFFKVGKQVYDPKAEDHRRWINLSIKGFGDIPHAVERMQLKEGSYVNIRGRLDEDIWEDQNGGTRRRIVVVAEEIEYAGGKPKDKTEGSSTGYTATTPTSAPAPQEEPGEFTGYEPFGGTSFFD